MKRSIIMFDDLTTNGNLPEINLQEPGLHMLADFELIRMLFKCRVLVYECLEGTPISVRISNGDMVCSLGGASLHLPIELKPICTIG